MNTIELIYRIKNAKTKEELLELDRYIPTISEEQRLRALERMDDGIYDENGTLIGEKHPDD